MPKPNEHDLVFVTDDNNDNWVHVVDISANPWDYIATFKVLDAGPQVGKIFLQRYDSIDESKFAVDENSKIMTF